MEELITNLHMHTPYSDGARTHVEIAKAALKVGLDAVIITDHNVLVQELDGYYQEGNRRVLLLVGEEVHNPSRLPQKSHLLILGAERELAPFSTNIQRLVDLANKAEAVTFVAHPYDPALPMFGEEDITWEDWQVEGITGLELWNGLSELKTVIHSRLDAVFFALFPQYLARGPQPQTLQKWDELLLQGKKVVAIGGSDAHELNLAMGPFRRKIYPYEFHFQCINTHLLVEQPLTGEAALDRLSVLGALRQGHCFIGYDLPYPTRGFRFTAQGKDRVAWMGDEIVLDSGITLQIRLPLRTECCLLCNGEPVKIWKDSEFCTYIANQPGAYRVECTIHHPRFLGKRRGWIYSNPIYVRPG